MKTFIIIFTPFLFFIVLKIKEIYELDEKMQIY